MTMLSRIFGFIRDMVIAQSFGAGAGADAFFVAFKIPNFLRRLFAEGAFSQAFVPVLSEYKAQREQQEVKHLVDNVAGVLAALLAIVTVIGILAAPVILTLFAPGFIKHADKFDLTVSLLRITFPYLFFISLTALAGGILNTYGRFAVPAFTPIFLNFSIIAAALYIAPNLDTPVIALAWGVLIGGLLQMIFQVPFLLRLGLLPRPRLRLTRKAKAKTKDEPVGRIMRLMAPAIFGVSVSQINLLLDTLIASFLITGSVSWLYYSDRLVEFPLGVFSIAIATVILPNLSQQHASGDKDRFSHMLDWALRWILIIGTPAAVGLAVLSEEMLCTLFLYGEFGQADVLKASQSLKAYAFGLLGFSFIKVLAPGYFSRQDTKTPVRIGVIAMVCNMVFNLILVFPLAHAGLALATSLSAFINAGLLFRGLRKEAVYRPGQGWLKFLLRIALANLVMVAFLTPFTGDLSPWFEWDALTRGYHLVLWIAAAAAVYAGSLLLLGVRWRDVSQSQESTA